MALIFLLMTLLGVAVVQVDYSFEVARFSLKRLDARSELDSMTNQALRWLSEEIRSGARQEMTGENLTNFNSLRIFSSNGSKGGRVEVFDMDYAPQNISEVMVPLLFPPSRKDAYMVRASIALEELAPMTVESVYQTRPCEVPGEGIVYILENNPLYRREIFR
jgi:hypothetical protein